MVIIISIAGGVIVNIVIAINGCHFDRWRRRWRRRWWFLLLLLQARLPPTTLSRRPTFSFAVDNAVSSVNKAVYLRTRVTSFLKISFQLWNTKKN